jgi:hypothetical protein
VSKRLIDKMFRMFRILPWKWRQFGEYFLLLLDFAKQGAIQRNYLLSKNIIPWGMDLLVGKKSRNHTVRWACTNQSINQIQSYVDRRTSLTRAASCTWLEVVLQKAIKIIKMGDKFQKPNFSFLVQIFSYLVRCSDVARDFDDVPSAHQEGSAERVEFSTTDIENLHCTV